MTKTQSIFGCFVFNQLLLFSAPIHAYIGPGLGGGAIAIIVGLLSTVFIALFALVWYPIKKLRKLKKPKEEHDDEENEPVK